MREKFRVFACRTAEFTGSPISFGTAVAIILIWLFTGPIFNYSDTWQLIINTGTTIITFLMVFLIQHAQNRDTQAIQLKLSELIRAHKGARNSLVDLEEMTDEQLKSLHEEFHNLHLEIKDTADKRGLKLKTKTTNNLKA